MRKGQQDSDVKDLPGSQPKGYFKGLDKETKEKRAKQFSKQAKMDDDNPAAYKQPPGNTKDTKPSEYTKRYQKMFGNKNEEVTPSDQFKIGTYKTKHFDICPMALKTFEENVEDGFSENAGFVDAVKAVDRYLGIEKELDKKGFATSDDYKKMERAVEFAKEKIQDAGLTPHKYHQIHLNVVKDLMDNDVKEDVLSEDYEATVRKKAKETGIPYSILKEVGDRGMAAWRTGHRPGATQVQWALARINSFATGGKTQKTTDKDLWDKYKKGKK